MDKLAEQRSGLVRRSSQFKRLFLLIIIVSLFSPTVFSATTKLFYFRNGVSGWKGGFATMEQCEKGARASKHLPGEYYCSVNRNQAWERRLGWRSAVSSATTKLFYFRNGVSGWKGGFATMEQCEKGARASRHLPGEYYCSVNRNQKLERRLAWRR